MADRPIIFSAPMVRALLDGRKTQTRRVLKAKSGILAARSVLQRGAHWLGMEYDRAWPLHLPYTPDDRLYVREAFITGHDIDDNGELLTGERRTWYRASDAGLSWYDADTESTLDNPPWKPSIHMPRWASRLTLTVTDVRVQRLQDISEADAVAEGIVPVTRRFPPLQGCLNQLRERTMYEWSGGWSVRAADAYAVLWNSLHGPGAWAENPWVVALTFTVQRGNIDQMPGVAG